MNMASKHVLNKNNNTQTKVDGEDHKASISTQKLQTIKKCWE